METLQANSTHLAPLSHYWCSGQLLGNKSIFHNIVQVHCRARRLRPATHDASLSADIRHFGDRQRQPTMTGRVLHSHNVQKSIFHI